MNSFAGQILPLKQLLLNLAKSSKPVSKTSQTGYMVVYPEQPEPIATIPSSVIPSRTNELANFIPPYTLVAYNVPPIPPQGTGIPYGPVPDEVFDSYLQHASSPH